MSGEGFTRWRFSPAQQARRDERAATIRHLRGKISAVKTAQRKLLLSEETAKDRIRWLQATISELRHGLHRREAHG